MSIDVFRCLEMFINVYHTGVQHSATTFYWGSSDDQSNCVELQFTAHHDEGHGTNLGCQKTMVN